MSGEGLAFEGALATGDEDCGVIVGVTVAVAVVIVVVGGPTVGFIAEVRIIIGG